ncbi:DUF4238 domain-containing protein [Desmonostoc muscorum CCALA 125]|nr:DUF4238 domain-containing protein [Desmonostoc muscorum CCALA 125]
MNKMPKVINQHYVPQSYLKNFSPDRSQIFVFDKPNKRSFPTHVKNIASERAFYDFPQSATQPENIQIIEEIFSGLETKQSRLFQHLQKKIDGIYRLRLTPNQSTIIYSISVLTEDQRQDLACVVAIQFLRTKEFRKFIVEMRQVTEPLTNHILEDTILEQIKQFEELASVDIDKELISGIKSLIFDKCTSIVSSMYDEGLAVIHAKFILDYYEQAAQIFNSHIWIIGVNDTGQPLFTSDNPVVRHPYLSSSGIASEGIEIAFPINNKAIMIMREKQHFHKFTNQDNKLFPLTLEDVEHYNRLQIYNSNRFVFCSEDSFDLVKTVCQQQSEICSEDRSRVQITNIEPQADDKDEQP